MCGRCHGGWTSDGALRQEWQAQTHARPQLSLLHCWCLPSLVSHRLALQVCRAALHNTTYSQCPLLCMCIVVKAACCVCLLCLAKLLSCYAQTCVVVLSVIAPCLGLNYQHFFRITEAVVCHIPCEYILGRILSNKNMGYVPWPHICMYDNHQICLSLYALQYCQSPFALACQMFLHKKIVWTTRHAMFF